MRGLLLFSVSVFLGPCFSSNIMMHSSLAHSRKKSIAFVMASIVPDRLDWFVRKEILDWFGLLG